MPWPNWKLLGHYHSVVSVFFFTEVRNIYRYLCSFLIETFILLSSTNSALHVLLFSVVWYSSRTLSKWRVASFTLLINFFGFLEITVNLAHMMWFNA